MPIVRCVMPIKNASVIKCKSILSNIICQNVVNVETVALMIRNVLIRNVYGIIWNGDGNWHSKKPINFK